MPRKRKQRARGASSSAKVEHDVDKAEIEEKFEAHFSKQFNFVKPRGKTDTPWTLPNAQDLFDTQDALSCSDLPSLTALKDELNSVKDLLSDKDIVLWHQHTQEVNFAGKVVPHVKHRAKAELCTQAWCKFYEILCTFPLVPLDQTVGTINSVHLCEAPGAFIAALNHYLALNHPHLKLSWLATTLNPYYEGNKAGQAIPDDRFILPTIEHWDFGEDNTGNIFSMSNRASLFQKAKKLGPIHLVTADGSIDCQNSPSEQELLVAPLHLVEVLTALRLLSENGNLVVKIFTCFEPTSVCLLYLLNFAFSQVHVLKPGTSKRGNSEVYVIALNYSGEFALDMHLAKIEDYLEQPFGVLAPMFTSKMLPSTFVTQMTECCTYFQKLQIEAIQEHLRLFDNMDPEQKRYFDKARVIASQMFVNKFGLVPIKMKASITKYKVLPKQCVQSKPLRVGSLNERKSITDLTWSQKLPYLEAELVRATSQEAELVGATSQEAELVGATSQISECANNETICVRLKIPLDNHGQINVRCGKEFEKCLNSHFCSYPVLHCFNDICQCVEESGHPNPRIVELDDLALTDVLFSTLTGDWPMIYYRFMTKNSQCYSLVARLQQYRKNYSERSTYTKVHLDDLRYNNSSWNVCYSAGATLSYLKRFCDVMELCCVGDGLIVAIGPLLTRVDVGLLYILLCAFKKVSMLSGLSYGQPVEFAICRNYVNPTAVSLMEKIKFYCDKDAILEVVNISSLFEEPFFTSLRNYNSCAVMKRAKFTLNYLKSLIPTNAETN